MTTIVVYISPLVTSVRDEHDNLVARINGSSGSETDDPGSSGSETDDPSYDWLEGILYDRLMEAQA